MKIVTLDGLVMGPGDYVIKNGKPDFVSRRIGMDSVIQMIDTNKNTRRVFIGPGLAEEKVEAISEDKTKLMTEPPRRGLSLLDMLRKYSYRKGTFTLASGKESDFYIDCKQTFLRRDGLWAAAAKLYSLTDRFGAVAVAGEGGGGVPLAAAVSMYSGVFGPDNQLHCIVVRKGTKNHGTENRVERARDVVPDGSKVVLVEDVLTSGHSALRAANALKNDGLKVAAVIALVSRREGAEELFYYESPELISLYKREDFIDG